MKKRVIVNIEYEIRYDNQKQYKHMIKRLKSEPYYHMGGTEGSFERKRVLSIVEKK